VLAYLAIAIAYFTTHECSKSPMNTNTEFWRDPAMPYVESRRACHSRACYKPHSHPSFSIGAVDLGTSNFIGAACGPMLIHAGTLVFVPSTCVHSCNPLPGSAWSYQMLHLDAHWLDALKRESCAGIQEDVVLASDTATYLKFCQLNALLFSAASVDEKETALIEFIGDYESSRQGMLAVAMTPAVASHRLKAAMDCLQHERLGMHSLAELARMVGMSRYQLIRAFRTATGMTPHAYQLNFCINQARDWLRQGVALADIAYRLGFADQSHFQRVFKAHTGVTPGLYKA
jgi:AraC-like DNA-binding protein